jgi:hypothetical protein
MGIFDLPTGANPAKDTPVGKDEMGRTIYQTGYGAQYVMPDALEGVRPVGTDIFGRAMIGSMPKAPDTFWNKAGDMLFPGAFRPEPEDKRSNFAGGMSEPYFQNAYNLLSNAGYIPQEDLAPYVPEVYQKANRYIADMAMAALSGIGGLSFGGVGLLGDAAVDLGAGQMAGPMVRDLAGMLETSGIMPEGRMLSAMVGQGAVPRLTEGISEAPGVIADAARSAGSTFVERMNQRGPMPTLYSNPIAGDVGRPPVTFADAERAMQEAQSNFQVTRQDASQIFGAGSERVRYTDPQSNGTIEVLVRPDGSASVLELEVPEANRGQGIGQKLQEQVMKDFPVMGGQVSSKAAATTAYRLGRRPPGKPNATLEDVFAEIDDMSSVNLVSPKMQPQSASVDTSYRMQHQPRGPQEENPIRLDDLTKSTRGEQAGYPADFYSTNGPRYYAPGPQFAGDEFGRSNRESYKVIAAVKGKPDAEVTIYRAVPNDPNITTINQGDFVTLSETYAKLHGASGYGRMGDEPGKIISQKVKVRDIYFDGNDVNEFGYFPVQSGSGPR